MPDRTARLWHEQSSTAPILSTESAVLPFLIVHLFVQCSNHFSVGAECLCDQHLTPTRAARIAQCPATWVYVKPVTEHMDRPCGRDRPERVQRSLVCLPPRPET